MNSEVVTILGPPRSGTSMTAGILSILGIPMGNVRAPDKFNPTGYFEDKEFQKLCYDILISAKQDSNGYFPPSKTELLVQAPKFSKRIRELIEKRSTDNRRWGWKIIATSLLMPIFYPIVPNIKIIVVYRNILSVSLSIQKHAEGKGYGKLSLPQAIDITLYYYTEINSFIKDHQGIPIYHLQYEKTITSPVLVIDQLCKFLNIDKKNIQKAQRFIRSKNA